MRERTVHELLRREPPLVMIPRRCAEAIEVGAIEVLAGRYPGMVPCDDEQSPIVGGDLRGPRTLQALVAGRISPQAAS